MSRSTRPRPGVRERTGGGGGSSSPRRSSARCVRARVGAHARRAPRTETARRLRTARRRTEPRSPRATAAVPAARTPRPLRSTRPVRTRAGRPPWSRSSPATTPGERGRARRHSSRRAYAASCSRSLTPTRSQPGGEVTLREAGVEVACGLLAREARASTGLDLRAWSPPAVRDLEVRHHASTAAAPLPTAPAAGSPRRRAARHPPPARPGRRDAGRHRHGEVDDPRLNVRDEEDEPLAHQPLRACGGPARSPGTPRPRRPRRDGPAQRATRTRRSTAARAGPPARLPRGRPDLAGASQRRPGRRGRRLRRPDLLGDGHRAVGDLGVTTIADAMQLASSTSPRSAPARDQRAADHDGLANQHQTEG